MSYSKEKRIEEWRVFMSEENKDVIFDKMMDEYTKKCMKLCIENNSIDSNLFNEFGVKRGLRDKNGRVYFLV